MRLFNRQDTLLRLIREGKPMTRRQKILLTMQLSLPAMLAQLSTIAMEYIDAAMVGSLGATATAAIGLVSTTTWLFGSISNSVSTGFYVQVAHKIGAKDAAGARNVLRQSLTFCLAFSLILMAIGCAISSSLPHWLGGGDDITENAGKYFLFFCLAIPFLQINGLAGGMLRCSGNMKIPSLLNVVSCILDVILNFIFIFRMEMGVLGAALGTFLSIAATSICMLSYLCFRSKEMNLLQDRGSFLPARPTLKECFHIATPIGIEHLVMCGAQIMTTVIVAPLGTVAIAANSFGIIIESLCYMPGYGISEAATTLVGQSLGARRKELCRSFSTITVSLGIGIMTVMGAIMYAGAPWLMPLMTPDAAVQDITVTILRIEAFAEPMFAAAIVSYGVFVGARDIIAPCAINLCSIWIVRITLSAILAGTFGLTGVWFAMFVELTIRGILFLVRLRSDKWMKFL